METEYRGTTICAVRRDGKVAIAGDGQVTHADMILKTKARKIRLLADGSVIAGFAELAKEWRTDKYLRRLEALLLACDGETTLLISGTGDVIEPDEDFAAIGSGAGYALAAAKALSENSKLTAEQIARRALEITAGICIYTNSEIVVESLG